MRKLPISTLTLGATLVLISLIAFGEPVAINIDGDRCIFLDPVDPNITHVVSPPDKIKAAQSKGFMFPIRATCQEASITTEGGQTVYYEGTRDDVSNRCMISTSSGWAVADYLQKTDKKGTKLTCIRN